MTGWVSNLDSVQRTHERLFGKDAVMRSDGWLTINTGRGRLFLQTAEEIRRLYPEAEPLLKCAPRLVSVMFDSDLDATERVLSERGVSFRRNGNDAIVVPPSEACGVVLEFAVARGDE
jgi:hypothetical protein